MKKLFTLFLFTIAFAYGHAQWTQSLSSTTEDLYDIHFADENVGYAVGTNGTVIKTIDGGIIWNNCFGIEENLYMVYVVDEQNVFVGGSTLYHSTDGGFNWEDLGFPYPKDIKFIDDMTGYLIDGTGMRVTYDGGVTWEVSHDMQSTAIMEEIAVNEGSEDEVITTMGNISGALSYSAMGYRTNEAGEWVMIDNASFPNAYAYTSYVFPDADSGYLFNNQNVNWMPSDNNQMVKMTDFHLGTDPWGEWRWFFASETVNEEMPGYVSDSWFVNMTNGWIVTSEGGIYLTKSGGETWIPEYEGEAAINSMACLNENLAYVAGEGGLILKKESTSTNTDIVSQEEISVTPTFVSESATVTGLNKNDEVRVYNMAGALVYQKDVKNDVLTIHTSGWNKGMYIIRVSSNGYAKNEKKFVVK